MVRLSHPTGGFRCSLTASSYPPVKRRDIGMSLSVRPSVRPSVRLSRLSVCLSPFRCISLWTPLRCSRNQCTSIHSLYTQQPEVWRCGNVKVSVWSSQKSWKYWALKIAKKYDFVWIYAGVCGRHFYYQRVNARAFHNFIYGIYQMLIDVQR